MVLNLCMVEPSFGLFVWHTTHTKSGFNFTFVMWTQVKEYSDEQEND